MGGTRRGPGNGLKKLAKIHGTSPFSVFCSVFQEIDISVLPLFNIAPPVRWTKSLI